MKVGVAGAGAMGRNHARVFSQLEGAELVAIYDADESRAREVATEFGSQAVSSLEELARLAEAVSVAVPTVAHLAVGGELLERGVHILMEKPIAPSLEDARKLVEISHRTGKILQVGHIERFNPVMKSLEARLNNPRFIEVHRLSLFPNRSLDIGVVLDLMIHDLEIILHLVHSPIISIDAVGVPVLSAHEDIANARLRFANGCVANVTASRISLEKMRKLRLFQSDAYLSLDYQEQAGQIVWLEDGKINSGFVEVEKDEPLKLELREFLEAAQRGGAPKVSGEQGMAALDIALEITRLIRESLPNDLQTKLETMPADFSLKNQAFA